MGLLNLYKNCNKLVQLKAYLRIKICSLERLNMFVPNEGLIYDIGCGIGVFSNFMALNSPKRSIIGFDISENSINEARKTICGRSNIDFICKSIEEIDDISKASVITIIDMFHHIQKSKQCDLLKSIYQKMNENCVLFFKECDTAPVWMHYANLLHDSIFDFGNKIAMRGKMEYCDILTNIGFNVDIVEMHKTYLAHVLFVCKKIR